MQIPPASGPTRIDHLVVTAPDLASGLDLVQRSLGVEPQPGGKHARMGTHNLVLKLGPSIYLEVISPDPDAPKPSRPRWFELDERRPARLATWVARTSDIHAKAAASSEPLGTIEAMSRGNLNWLITMRADGSFLLGGAAPAALIEWKSEPHPAAQLRDTGCSLSRLEAFHPDPPRLSALLESIDLQDDVSVVSLAAGEPPYVVAHFQTAAGPKRLSGRTPHP